MTTNKKCLCENSTVPVRECAIFTLTYMSSNVYQVTICIDRCIHTGDDYVGTKTNTMRVPTPRPTLPSSREKSLMLIHQGDSLRV